MASQRNIKGITIEIGGDTTGLQKALGDVNKKVRDAQTQLKDVDRLLKLDPSNTELLAQKQRLLGEAITQTKDKLVTLKTASEQAAKTAGNYDAWKAKYDPIQAEIKETNDQLVKLKEQAQKAEQQLSEGKISQEKYDSIQAEIKETEQSLKDLKEQSKAVTEEFGNPVSTEQYDALQREIIATEQELKRLEKAAGTGSVKLEEIGAAAGKFGSKAEDVGKKLLPATAAVTGLATAAVKTAADFDSAMAQVAAVSGAAGDELEALREKAREMGEKTKFSASEAAEAMNYMAMAGWKTEDMLNGIEGIMNLAAASGEDLATTSDIVTDALTGFGLKASDAGHFADVLAAASSNANTNVSMMGETFKYAAPIAGSLGYSVEDTAEAIGLMANAGIKASQAGTSLRSIMTRLATNAGASSQSFGALEILTNNLGVQFYESSGKLRDFGDVIRDTREAWKGLSKEEQSNYAKKIAGTNALSGFLALMNAQESDVTKLNKAIAESTNEMTGYSAAADMAATMQDNLQGQLTILKSQLEELAISFGDILMPTLRSIVGGVQSFVNWLNGLDDGTRKVVTTVALFVAALGPVLVFIGKISTGISALIKFLPTLMSIIGKIKTVVTALFTLIAAHPVIAVITTVIAAVVLLYNKCEWFRDAVKAVWTAISSAFTQAWSAIITFFTVTIPEAWNSLVAFFQGIPAWWSGLWQQVADFFGNIWTQMMNNPVIAEVVTTITDLWNNCVSMLQGIWDGLNQIAAGAWELLKNTILGPVLLLIDLVTGDFEKLRDDAQHIWENIQQAAEKIWNGVKKVVSSLVDGLVKHVVTLFEGFRDTLGEIWDVVSSAASGAWERLKDFVVDTAESLKDSAVDAFWSLVDGISDAVSGIYDAVVSGFQSAIDFITSLPSQAVQWGADFVNGIVDGIWSAIGAIADAASNVAETIRSYLHFSVPDVGPLTDYESWMPDFMKGLAKGIEKSKGIVTDAIAGVSKGMTFDANAMVEQNSAAQNGGLNAILSVLAQYLPYLSAGQNLYLDKRELAGRLAPDMNLALGQIKTRGERL